MTAITPRWEWRTFGNDFGEIEARLRASSSVRRDSTETYIVSRRNEINAKVRAGALDVKVLQQVDSRGLELWLPVMIAPFPLSIGYLTQIFNAWKLEPPDQSDRAWTRQAFFEYVATAQPSLTPVVVTKTRYGVVIDECLVEIADLRFDGAPIRTIAVEAPDAERVWRTVETLGLSSLENVNYVKALKRYLAPRRAQL